MTDRFNPSTPRTTFALLHISSVLTLLAYSYLLLPPSWTGSPWLAMFLFATGHGMATLLLVILVARLLPSSLIPLGLGLHKSMEMASSSLSQTLAGLWLDWTKHDDSSERNETEGAYQAGEGLLRIFWTINILQLSCVILLWRFEGRRRKRAAERAVEYERLPMSTVSEGEGDETDPEVLEEEDEPLDVSSLDDTEEEDEVKRKAPGLEQVAVGSALALDDAERRRGKVFFRTSLGFIAFVWAVFLASAWSRL